MLNAVVGVSNARRTALLSTQQAVPNAIPIRALVDTGASGTCIDPSVLDALGLTPTGSTQVCTPSTGTSSHTADLYDVSLFIPGANQTQPPLTIANLPVMSAQLLVSQGFHALIGRDILARCLMTYNGVLGQFTLAY
jgi:predicted aspartyl protease